LEHYLGGSQPQLFHLIADEPFSKMEETKSQMVEENEWKGVKTTWTIKKENFTEIMIELVNLLKLKSVWVLSTSN
ncbi:unnamed protein product, partial [marine sediment metagenome]